MRTIKKLFPSTTMWVIPYLALWLFAFYLWNRLSNMMPLTIMQSIVSLIYVSIFVWIIQCPRTLWMILGGFYGIIVLRYIYSAWFYKKTVEGFETAGIRQPLGGSETAGIRQPLKNPDGSETAGGKKPTKDSNTASASSVAATGATTATTAATLTNTIPLTKEAMDGTNVIEVDEWTETEKRKIEGNPLHAISEITGKSGKMQTEEEREKQRSGITFTSSAAAQQETYKLIDAVQQLQEVMTNLSPTLREGKKIIDMFEKFQIKK